MLLFTNVAPSMRSLESKELKNGRFKVGREYFFSQINHKLSRSEFVHGAQKLCDTLNKTIEHNVDNICLQNKLTTKLLCEIRLRLNSTLATRA